MQYEKEHRQTLSTFSTTELIAELRRRSLTVIQIRNLRALIVHKQESHEPVVGRQSAKQVETRKQQMVRVSSSSGESYAVPVESLGEKDKAALDHAKERTADRRFIYLRQIEGVAEKLKSSSISPERREHLEWDLKVLEFRAEHGPTIRASLRSTFDWINPLPDTLVQSNPYTKNRARLTSKQKG